MLKLARPDIKIVVAEPENAQILAKGTWEVHKVQGWTPDFVPTLLDRNVIDSLVTINPQQALHTAREMAAKEGILVGISAGATIATAMNLAKSVAPGSVILAMAPDTGERYLSTELFNDLGNLDTDPGIRYWEATQASLEQSEV